MSITIMDYYYDIKKVALHGEGVDLLAELLLEEMAHFAPKSVGGLEMGAILATSIMLKSTCAGKSRTKFIFYTMDI